MADAHAAVRSWIARHTGDGEATFDMVLGFSQGAAVAASLLLHHELDRQAGKSKTTTAGPPFRAAVFMCSPLPFSASLAHGIDARSYFGVGRQPSLEDLGFEPGRPTTVPAALIPADQRFLTPDEAELGWYAGKESYGQDCHRRRSSAFLPLPSPAEAPVAEAPAAEALATALGAAALRVSQGDNGRITSQSDSGSSSVADRSTASSSPAAAASPFSPPSGPASSANTRSSTPPPPGSTKDAARGPFYQMFHTSSDPAIRIPVPTAHILGRQDKLWREHSRELVKLCAEKPAMAPGGNVGRYVYEFDGGHEIPCDEGDVEVICDVIESVAARAGLI